MHLTAHPAASAISTATTATAAAAHVRLVSGESGSKGFKTLKFIPYKLPNRSGDFSEYVDTLLKPIRDRISKEAAADTPPEFVFQGDAMTVRCVVFNQDLDPMGTNVHSIDVPVYKPTKAGGHEFAKNKDILKKICLWTHPAIANDEELNKTEVKVYAVRSLDANVILLFPEAAASPAYLSKLNVPRDPRDPDSIAAVELRLNDGTTLGKSATQICASKFRHLFPGVPIDTSKVPKKKRKASAAAIAPEKADERDTFASEKEDIVGTLASSLLHASQTTETAMIVHFLKVLRPSKETNLTLRMFSLMTPEACIDSLSDRRFLMGLANLLNSQEAEDFIADSL